VKRARSMSHPESSPRSREFGSPRRPAVAQPVILDVTSLGSVVVLGVVTCQVVGYLASEGKRHAAAVIAVAVAGDALISTGLKLLIGRPRPDLVPHLAEVSTLSFPSGHAMLSEVTYLTLGALLTRQVTHRSVMD
jgi:undecaprenyl-diphosphatase